MAGMLVHLGKWIYVGSGLQLLLVSDDQSLALQQICQGRSGMCWISEAYALIIFIRT